MSLLIAFLVILIYNLSDAFVNFHLTRGDLRVNMHECACLILTHDSRDQVELEDGVENIEAFGKHVDNEDVTSVALSHRSTVLRIEKKEITPRC